MPDHSLPREVRESPPAARGEDPLRPEAVLAAPTPRRRRVLVLVVLALAALGTVAAFWPQLLGLGARPVPVAATPATPPPALTVGAATVAPRSMARTVVGDGSVVAWQELVIGAEAGGLRVAEVLVEEGDTVSAGQLLVRLDDALLRAAFAQAEAAVAEVDSALRIARQELARATELVRTNSAARQTLEQREAAAIQAEARLASAAARREEATARLAQARILAPTDGIVSRRSALPGNVTGAGQEMVRIIRDGRLELDARVPELELATLAPGQPVRVIHGGRVVPAELRAIAPTVAADTRLGTVHVALPAGSGLRPGMFARAEILPPAEAALAVPQAAVLFRDGRPAVFVLDGNQVSLRQVATGRRHDGVVEVTSGLAAGDRVVVAGAAFLSDGDRVRVAPEGDRTRMTPEGDRTRMMPEGDRTRMMPEGDRTRMTPDAPAR